MREPRRRHLLPTAAALLALLVGGSAVVASAASLGGVDAERLGGAAGDVRPLDAVTLSWTPTWQSGAWRLVDLTLRADAGRGFLAGDEVRVTLDAAQPCEVVTTVTAAATTVVLGGSRLAQACGAAPALAGLDGVAVAVTGVDDVTLVGDLGPLTGSVGGYAGAAVRTVGAASATVSGGRLATITVGGVTPADLEGATVAVAVVSGSTVVGTAQVPGAQVQLAGGTATIDVAARSWAPQGTVTVTAAISTPQRLTAGIGDRAAVLLATGTVSVGSGGSGGDGTGGTGGDGGNGGNGSTQPGSALDPVAVSNGIGYRYANPWTGVQTNRLTFCHSFTVTNTRPVALADWTITFDTRLAPMWGLNPTAGTVSLSGIETRGYVPETGLWTVGGSGTWNQRIEAGGSRTMQICATSVPMPPDNPSLYDVRVSVVAENDWNVTFRVDVTSTSRFYVPWRLDVDLATLVCPASLQRSPVRFDQVVATPVAGSTTAYRIQGTDGSTQLVSASHPRSFTFAVHNPGPGWRLPCG